MKEVDALVQALSASDLGKDVVVQRALEQLRLRIGALEQFAAGTPCYQLRMEPSVGPFMHFEEFPDGLGVGIREDIARDPGDVYPSVLCLVVTADNKEWRGRTVIAEITGERRKRRFEIPLVAETPIPAGQVSLGTPLNFGDEFGSGPITITAVWK